MENQKEIEERKVDQFAQAMKDKLEKYRDKNPESWTDADLDDLYDLLDSASVSEDMVSVAIYAMMIHDRL